jgi:hypothetical protein
VLSSFLDRPGDRTVPVAEIIQLQWKKLISLKPQKQMPKLKATKRYLCVSRALQLLQLVLLVLGHHECLIHFSSQFREPSLGHHLTRCHCKISRPLNLLQLSDPVSSTEKAASAWARVLTCSHPAFSRMAEIPLAPENAQTSPRSLRITS